MAWRLARSLDTLRAEVNDRWPHRSKVSDGTRGDQAHAARPSDHNPNAQGVVRALDITAAGIDAGWYAEHLRKLGASGHPPLRNGGIVIHNRRITSSARAWQWRPYTGPNPHISHVHVSVGRTPAEYDATTRWGITDKGDDDFMPALTHAEQRELLAASKSAAVLAASVDQRCARLERSIHGDHTVDKGGSIWWRVTYLSRELLEGSNLERLRQLLRHGTGP